MQKDTEKAKTCLFQGHYTCVLCRGDVLYQSTHRGVKPLLDFLDSGVDFTGFCAADKVVGRATAFLYCLLGVKSLHAGVLSKPAKQVLEKHHIPVSYDCLVEGIRNREDTGPCPMEHATRDIHDPTEALAAIRKTLLTLS